MQTLLDFLAPPTSIPPSAPGLRDDQRDHCVGLVCAVGLCAFVAADLISLL